VSQFVGDEPILTPLWTRQSSCRLCLRSWRITTSAMERTIQQGFRLRGV